MSFSLRRVPGQDQPRHHSAQSPAFWPEAFSTTRHGPTIQANAARHVTKSPAFGPEAFTAHHDVTRLRHTSLHAAQSPASGPEAFRTRPYAALRIASNRDTPLRQHRPKGRKLSTPSPHVTKPHKSNLCGTPTPAFGREAFRTPLNWAQQHVTSRNCTKSPAFGREAFSTGPHTARRHMPLPHTITGFIAGSFLHDETTPRATNLYGTSTPAFGREAFSPRHHLPGRVVTKQHTSQIHPPTGGKLSNAAHHTTAHD